MPDSSIPKFFEKTHKERLDIVKKFSNLSDDDISILQKATGGISFTNADNMVENCIGTFSLPIGIATNFKINGKDYLVPMVIEEPSVVAAASKGAKIARVLGGFSTSSADESYSIGQVQILGINDDNYADAIAKINQNENKILEIANAQSKTLSKMGKGAKKLNCRRLDTDLPLESMLIVELSVDVGDAMGANITNSMCEAIAPLLEEITGGTVLLKILSNYSIHRMVKVTATFEQKAVGGKQIVDNMISAYKFAKYDVYRAVTHNKGVMNGSIAVAAATGQDTRAIEAAVHAYASSTDLGYSSLTDWSVNQDGDLVGVLEIPLAVGTVGGIINSHPMAKLCTKILDVSTAKELAGVIAAVGLAQNFSAMRALATEGIQKGHMRLHARNLAVTAGASNTKQIDAIVQKMVQENNITLDRAKEIMKEL
jgi:hydroxymethylglutaryl-CoA reductase